MTVDQVGRVDENDNAKLTMEMAKLLSPGCDSSTATVDQVSDFDDD